MSAASDDSDPTMSAQRPLADAPMLKRPWGFWTTLAWTLLSGAGGVAAAWPVIAMLEAVPGTLFRYSVISLVAFCVIAIVMTMTLAIAARLARWTVRDYFALCVPRHRDVLLGMACLGLWLGFGETLHLLFGIGDADTKLGIEEYRIARAGGTLPLLWITAVIVAPVTEESVFRGFIYRGWSQTRLGAAGTVLVTSILFGLAHWHYTWVGVADTIVFGLIVGWMRWRSQSLFAAIALHAVNNLVATIYAAVHAG